MVESREVLDRFIRWCPRCLAVVQVAKVTTGELIAWRCRRCDYVVDADREGEGCV